MNRAHDPLDSIYTQQKESKLRRYGGRIAGGIACSAFIYFVMHVGFVMKALAWACTIFLAIVGRPQGAVRLGKELDKAHDLAPKVEELVKKHHSPGVLAPVLAPVKEVVKVKETVDHAKEKAKEGVDAVKKTGTVVKETGEKVADALSGAGTRAKEAVGGVGGGIAGLYRARAEAREREERDQLIVHARRRNFKIDESWSFTRLKAEVAEAERQWQAKYGPNARCPNPKCYYGMHISPKATGERRCPRCNEIFSAKRALVLGKARR